MLKGWASASDGQMGLASRVRLKSLKGQRVNY